YFLCEPVLLVVRLKTRLKQVFRLRSSSKPKKEKKGQTKLMVYFPVLFKAIAVGYSSTEPTSSLIRYSNIIYLD
ncbi:hypothetical protein, partial [Flavobacterium columnare]